jgi:ACR3 family arsenite transporter
MMYPIMVKIDFGEVVKAGKSGKPVYLTLFINWAVKPFTMYAIAMFFLGFVFKGFIGPDAVDLVKMPFGLNLPVGAAHGAGVVYWRTGSKCFRSLCGDVPAGRSFLGIARAPPWCLCGATFPAATTVSPWYGGH